MNTARNIWITISKLDKYYYDRWVEYGEEIMIYTLRIRIRIMTVTLLPIERNGVVVEEERKQ